MGLFQRACETYDNSTNEIGIYSQNKEPLAPIGHVVKKASLEVTIDIEGNFVSARVFDNVESQILMPATNAALNRSSSTIAPYPLGEQLCYLAAYDAKSEQKQKAYLEQLHEWAASDYGTPEIRAVQTYVSRNQLCNDLENAGLLKFDDEHNLKSDKDMVAWKVLGGGGESATWRNLTLIQNYIDYSVVQEKTVDHNICMISGEAQPIIEHHLKGIFSLNGNAKLISSNDSANFTYRGRFNTPGEAVTVGDISSQKAHNALKWLISNQAVIIGGRAFLCWCPQGDVIPKIQLPLINLSDYKDSLASDPSEYKDLLNKAIMGYESGLSNKVTSRTVISCFDAATSGRLSVTLYSEMMTETFLSRLILWDENCSWYFGDRILSPSVVRIAEYAFGNERDRTGNGKVELDDKVKKQQVERLIHCRIGESRFPSDIIKSIVRKASNLMNYGKYSRRELLSTACAVIKKYFFDYMKEELSMDLEKGRQDRSYQFGRLLAVYEKIERDTFGETESREPNAIRLQSVYSHQPLHYAYELDKQMERAYIPRLKPSARAFYKNLISEIMQVIFNCPENTWNKPLKETYLMGYYLQRKSLYTKKEKSSETENSEE